MGEIIANLVESSGEGEEPILSLIFAPGKRPRADLVEAAGLPGESAGSFAISHRPDEGEGWVELLSLGLTFDCSGLEPAPSQPMPLGGALLGLDAVPSGEVLTLAPGPHIAKGRGLLPVVRILAAVGARLATLEGLRAVCWQPAECWMEAAYFRRVVGDWLSGGPFPALGLTSLRRESSGAMVSVGLGLLIGQELRFEAERALSAGAVARISVRLIHELVISGPLNSPHVFDGPDGERLLAVPVADGEQLRVIICD